MIGYVLLVSAMIVMALIVFQWMKTYVPKDTLECPDDVSLLISKTDCSNSSIYVNVKNTGLFDINGYIIRGIKKDDYGLDEIIELNDGYFIFSDVLKPNSNYEQHNNFGGDGTNIYNIESIEIVPVRFQKDNAGKERTVVCGDAAIKKELNCEVKLKW